MRTSINIQSYKRAGKVDTLAIFPDATLWVHKFEIEDYKKAHPSNRIKELPDETRGNLPKVKNYIMDGLLNKGNVLFLDDDIKNINIWENKKARILSTEELIRLIEKFSIMCEDWGFKLWGINVNQDKQCYREYTPFSTLSYVSSSFACFLSGCELRYDEKLPLKEDYDMTIMQCNKYRGLLRVNRMFYNKKSAENIGGCATYRNIDKEKEQIILLQKKWGNKIVKVDSNNRSHSSKKQKNFTIDINPIINVPISGV